MPVIKASEVKRAIKEGGKRCSKEFIAAFDHQVTIKLQQCIKEHAGGKKTLDAGVAILIFGGKRGI